MKCRKSHLKVVAAAAVTTSAKVFLLQIFQNESEETNGKEKKGNRAGVLRCGYCVKQGNVVSARPQTE